MCARLILIISKTDNLSKLNNFVGIGECMIELSQGEGANLKRSFAGDVLNTLWYAHKDLSSGWNTQFYSAVGSDPMSEDMLTFISDAGIDVAQVRRIENRRPGLYMIHLDGAERSFSYWRDHSAAKLLANDNDHLAASLNNASVIYFSGITTAILSPDDFDTLLTQINNEKAGGKIVAFDPNIRPALWQDEAYMRQSIERAASCATIVLPSFDDEQNAFGDKTPDETVKRYHDCGAETVVLKNGAGNVLGSTASETFKIKTKEVTQPIDTTGAGDSFNGAFLAQIVQTENLSDAIRAGQACAAKVICHYGALMD